MEVSEADIRWLRQRTLELSEQAANMTLTTIRSVVDFVRSTLRTVFNTCGKLLSRHNAPDAVTHAKRKELYFALDLFETEITVVLSKLSELGAPRCENHIAAYKAFHTARRWKLKALRGSRKPAEAALVSV